jgi:uncharacterized membrane protein HdeD (DUF308 family)
MTTNDDPESVERRAPVYMLRGLVAIAVGIYCFRNADSSTKLLATIVGSLLVIEAFLNFLNALLIVFDRHYVDKAAVRRYIVVGITSVILALGFFLFPIAVAGILLLIVAVWFIVLGCEQLRVASDNGRKGCNVATGLIASAYVLVGIYFLFHINNERRAVVQVAGVIIFIFGMQMIWQGLQLQFGTQGRYSPISDGPANDRVSTV